VTRHPTAEWVVQQLREAFLEAGLYRYVILDRDAKFDAEVVAFLQRTGLKLKRTSIRSPWQNGIAERWMGSCRRELLDHVIPLNEQHLRRLVRDYVGYHQEDRIHDALGKDTPNLRPVETKRYPEATVVSSTRWAVFIIATPGVKQLRRLALRWVLALAILPSSIEAAEAARVRPKVGLRGQRAQDSKGRKALDLASPPARPESAQTKPRRS
jgi:hypothetical protein